MLAVGIGSFWFSAKKQTDGVKSGDNLFVKHLKDVKSVLEGIDNVSNLEIRIDCEEFSDLDLESTLDDGDDDDYDRPLFNDGSIDFDLYLPIRVQERYGFGRRVDTEKFRVSIRYSYHFPVTFIYYSVPDDEIVARLSPSQAIMITREFLVEKLKSDPRVQFNCIGPSPFHVDLIVKYLEDGEDIESTVELPSRGYHTILMKILDEDDDPIQVVVDRYQDILSSFYYITWCRVSLLRGGHSIVGLVRELLGVTGSKSPFAHLRAMSKRENIITDIFNRILEDKMKRISLDEFVNEVKRTGTVNSSNIFAHFIDEAVLEIPILPTEEIRKVVDIIEGRTRNFFQNGATLLAGLLGAIIGSLLTIMLSHAGNNQSGQTPERFERPAVIAPPSPPLSPALPPSDGPPAH
jgi:hypothetical protein